MHSFTIRKQILVSVPREKLFDALTDSQSIIEYFPLDEVISDWTVGGEVIYKGHVDGIEFSDYGIIEVLQRPREYKYSYWSTNHGTRRVAENHVSIAYNLLVHEEGTQLVVEQSNIKSRHLYQQMNSVVWESLLNQLKTWAEANNE